MTLFQPLMFITVLGMLIAVVPSNENKAHIISTRKTNLPLQRSMRGNSSALDGQLVETARCGDASSIRRLVASGANPNARGPKGITPLMVAAARGNVAVGTALIEKGADLNLPDTTEWRLAPLMVASACGRYEFVDLLLNKSARVDVVDKANATAWAYATFPDNKELSNKIRTLLLAKGTPAINADSTSLFMWIADNPAFDCANSYLKSRFKGIPCPGRKTKQKKSS